MFIVVLFPETGHLFGPPHSGRRASPLSNHGTATGPGKCTFPNGFCKFALEAIGDWAKLTPPH